MDTTFQQPDTGPAWPSGGFRCTFQADPPGRQSDPTTHDADSVIFVFEGRLEVTVAGKTHHAKAGDKILVPAGLPRIVRTLGPAETLWFEGVRAPILPAHHN